MFFWIAAAVILILIFINLKDLQNRWMAYFVNSFTKQLPPKIVEFKNEHLSGIRSEVSQFPELRKEKAIKILEIGVGSGANFEYYPDGTRLVVIDPNPHFKKYYDENRSKFSNIQSEEIIVATGEKMDMIEDNSVDVVVMTLVMCSVQDIPKILKQIHRVLAPGGKFYFFEHIREWDPKKYRLRQILQDFFSNAGIWPFLFDGCHLNRDMLDAIKSTGFSQVDGKRRYAPPISHPIFKLIRTMLVGVATK